MKVDPFSHLETGREGHPTREEGDPAAASPGRGRRRRRLLPLSQSIPPARRAAAAELGWRGGAEDGAIEGGGGRICWCARGDCGGSPERSRRGGARVGGAADGELDGGLLGDDMRRMEGLRAKRRGQATSFASQDGQRPPSFSDASLSDYHPSSKSIIE